MTDKQQKALVDRIVSEVLHRIKALEPQDEQVSGRVVLVTSRVPSPKSALESLEKTNEGETKYITFDTQFELLGQTVIDAWQMGQQAVLEEVASSADVVLLAPKIGLLHDIAAGNDEEFVQHLVIRSLLWGRNVSILLDFQPPRFRRNTFYEKLVDVITALEDMGVTIRTYKCAVAHDGEARTLVTENDVTEAYKQKKNEINCVTGAIVTPAAKDKAQELGIRINY